MCEWFHKIQVFNREGVHQRTICPQGLNFPTDISITPHHLFVSSHSSNICKLDKLSGVIMCSVESEDTIHGLSADSDTLYAGMRESNQISHLSLEDLTIIRVTPLNSPHITQDTRIRDLKIATFLFIILFGKCNNPIQTFSRDGNLMQVIV